MNNHKTMRLLRISAVILANLIWSGSFSATAIAVHFMSPAFLTMVRLGTGALVLSPFLRLTGGKRWDWRTIFQALVLGAVGFAAPVYLETKGLALSTPALAAISIAMEPLFTVLVATALLREHLGVARRWATVLAFFGAWAIAGFPRPGRSGYLAGDLFMVGAVFCYALYNAYSKRLTNVLPPSAATAATLWGGFFASIPLWWMSGAVVPHQMTGLDWVAVLYLALLATSGAYVLWMFALKSINVSFAALFLYMQPVLGVVLSVWIVGTRPGLDFYAGAACILAAIVMGRDKATIVSDPPVVL